jgi:hypothetical protein
MKKILSFIIIIVALNSCSENVSVRNDDVFQGVKDNIFWEGSNAKATKSTGNKLAIQAVTLTETMTLNIPVPPLTINPLKDTTFKTYDLGTTLTSKASYGFKDGTTPILYETAIGVGDGQIIISQYDGATISGKFRFNALNTDPNSVLAPIVNLQNGVFYKVPVVTAP